MKMPALRFPEFSDPWKPTKAGEAFINSRVKGEEGLPIYSVTLDRGMVRRDTLERQMAADAADETNLRAQPGDLVYNMMRMWQGAVGKAPVECMVSPAYVVLSPKAKTSSEFFEYWFKSSRALYLLWAYSHGLTNDRLRLYFKDFAQIPLHLPSLSEQQKIAGFLGTLDARLQGMRRRRDLLARYKGGLIQKLFSKELRFTDDTGQPFPDWGKKRLGDLGTFRGGGTPDTDVAEYWTGDIPWVSSSDVSDDFVHKLNVTRKISDAALKQSATKRVPKNSILIVSRVGVGKLAVSFNEVCTSQDFCNFTPAYGDPLYLAYCLKVSKNKLLSLSQGTSIKGLTSSELKSLEVDFPHEDEQHKIAMILSALDVKIDSFAWQIERLENFKKGLLQQMFA